MFKCYYRNRNISIKETIYTHKNSGIGYYFISTMTITHRKCCNWNGISTKQSTLISLWITLKPLKAFTENGKVTSTINKANPYATEITHIKSDLLSLHIALLPRLKSVDIRHTHIGYSFFLH